IIYVHTGCGISIILILGSKQMMCLSADVGDSQLHGLGQLAFDREIVLLCILGSKMWLKFTIQKNRPEGRPVNAACRSGRIKTRSLRSLSDNSTRRVRDLHAVLSDERGVEHGVGRERANAERRFRAELLHDQLFDWIVENSITCTDSGFARATRKF